MNKRSLMSALLALAVVSGVGCVAQKERDDLLTQYRKCEEQNEELRARLAEARERIRVLSSAPQTAGGDAELAAARSEVARLQSALNDAERRIRDLANATPVAPAPIVVAGPLPQALDDALRRLAESNPQMMSYDEARGMVKFTSDFTFGSGSDKVEAAAVDALRRLAGVLNTPMASGYEIRIVGHTDNVPIRHSAQRHPTNWHLSVHRAIAVKDALAGAGVAEPRMSVAGYGEFRPVVPNGAQGARANRRVEVYLVHDRQQPMAGPAPFAMPEGPPAAPAAAEDDGAFK